MTCKSTITLFILFSFLMTGCSFSKDKDISTIPQTVKPKILSENQRQALRVIEKGDVSKLKEIVSRFSTEDFTYLPHEETPMAAALKLDLPNLVDIIFDLQLDPWNLGSANAKYNRKTFHTSVRSTLEQLKHSDANKIKDTLNSAEKQLFSKQTDEISKIFESSLKHGADGAAVTYNRVPLNCEFTVSQLVLLVQKRGIEDFNSLEIFLKEMPCRSSVYEIGEIYKIELIRQFQSLFAKPSLLRFVARHENLSSQLWNIDDSGILVSPFVLMRIAYSPESSELRGYDKDTYYCGSCDETDWKVVRKHSEEEIIQRVLDMGFVLPEYELIETVSGEVRHSFKNFVRQSVYGDPFFMKVTEYLLGENAVYNELTQKFPRPWDLGFQQMENDIVIIR